MIAGEIEQPTIVKLFVSTGISGKKGNQRSPENFTNGIPTEYGYDPEFLAASCSVIAAANGYASLGRPDRSGEQRHVPIFVPDNIGNIRIFFFLDN